VTHADVARSAPCRCELLQAALGAECWPALSVEHLLDRLSEADHPPAGAARRSETDEGTAA
jgi:hypothetical protein